MLANNARVILTSYLQRARLTHACLSCGFACPWSLYCIYGMHACIAGYTGPAAARVMQQSEVPGRLLADSEHSPQRHCNYVDYGSIDIYLARRRTVVCGSDTYGQYIVYTDASAAQLNSILQR